MSDTPDVKVIVDRKFGDTLSELIGLILLLLLIGHVFASISGGLAAKFKPGNSIASGFGVSFPPDDSDIIFPPRNVEFAFPPSDPVVIAFPPQIGEDSNVVALSETEYRSSPGGPVIGSVPAGTKGEVVGGPVWEDGVKYWEVEFSDGSRGWVAEGDIRSGDTRDAIGEGVKTYRETEIYDGPNGEVVGVVPAGSEGEIVGGPEDRNGVRYWEVEFSDGSRGWVAEDDLFSTKENDTHGEEVATIGDTAVYDKPGGVIVGIVPENEKGVIIGGPQDKDGVRYYEVLFDDGTTGWVKESDLVSTRNNPVLGQEVATYEVTPLYDRPGGTQIGSVPKDTKGEILDGPVLFEGERYWFVEFENGQRGWIAESRLMPSGDTPGIGARIELATDTAVYDTPGGNVIAQKKAGDVGRIIGGPVDRDGVRYWLVEFEDGTVGWVPEQALNASGSTKLWNWFLLTLQILSYVLIVLLATGIIFILIRQTQLAKADYKKYWDTEAQYGPEVAVAPLNPEWERIETLMESDNENDWRVAIMNADILLDEMLAKMGYHGDSVGEKLKQIEISDFNTLNQAWEAHTVRNMLAHEKNIVLSQREALRVIALFKEVFEEFKLL